ncbi:carcinine transporter-like [Pieris brassicae]|uniref:Major facilitator superfamily (MFS) profile domain-containing protein n=1 Tax=Pieris brassicae TaxID=7116 RepID=A0A9P0TQ42_PIEBR|nr:carcinine transporter-like [Pieris brassicae]CAH4035602.1 unnamed protein product [Pieris brassicae]
MSEQHVDFDSLLSAAGELGPYQLYMSFAMFPFYTFVVFVYFTQIFLTEVSPNHWCRIPELENLTEIERRDYAAPPDESRFGYSRCSTYDVNWADIVSTGNKPDRKTPTIPCQHGWEFNKSEIPYPTITSEMGWVCDKDSYPATAQAIYFVGSIIGSLIIGYLADRYGRLSAAIISTLMGGIFGILTIFSNNIYDFSVYRFLTGTAYDSCRIMAYLICLEFIVPKHRSSVSNVTFGVFYCLAVIVLPWIALACGDWKITALVTSIPLLTVILAPLYLPESPKWLLSKGRVDEAIKKAERVAEVNKKVIPPELIEKFKVNALNCEEAKDMSIIEVFKRPYLRNIFLIICLQYTLVAMTFDALFRTINLLDFNFFISFTLISSTELPSSLVVGFIMDVFGRRVLIFVLLVLTSIFGIMTTCFSGWQSVACAVAMRFVLNMAYNISIQWVPEVMPAAVRASGVNIAHICSSFAMIFSPYIVYSEVYYRSLPILILSVCSLVAAATALFLPETANKVMPQTFDDAEKQAKDHKLWVFACSWSKPVNKDLKT